KIEAEIGELGDFFSRGKTFPEKDVKINVDERNETLLIEVEAKRQQMWFFRTTPSVNLKIFVPENHPLNYDISQRNGSIHAHDIPIRQHFEASTTNGRVEVSDLT